MANKQIRVGLLGFGTVGRGTWQALEMNRAGIAASTGLDVRIEKILVRDPDRDRGVALPAGILTRDPEEILSDPSIDIVAEVLGGVEPAGSYMLRALTEKKHVVTANKAAVAARFRELRDAAAANRVLLRCEACVAGGIPILNAITTALRSNRILSVKGIVNGTTNYILTQMAAEGLSYGEALRAAQEKGFAEADPTDDVEGIDAANKLSILLALAFGADVPPGDIPTQGIAGVTADQIRAAGERGHAIKLVAGAEWTDQGLRCKVGLEELPLSHPLAGVHNEFNAVFVEGNAVGELMFYGKGAGALPTGSAVLGDIIGIGEAIAGKERTA